MRKLIVTEWITLDGVFDSDDEYFQQWFLPYHSDERAQRIQENILGCGALLMGRKTYDFLAPYWSSLQNNEMGVADKMNNAPKIVVAGSAPKSDWNNTQKVIKDNAIEEIANLKQEPGDYILTPGSSELVYSLMDAGLVDEYRFLVHPIVMGQGKRFFDGSTPFAKLNLIKSEQLPLGVVALTYEPASN